MLYAKQAEGLGGALSMYFDNALTAFEEALSVFRDGYPMEKAQTLFHWGATRNSMPEKTDESREEVIEVYDQALSVATKKNNPSLYAQIQISKSVVYNELPKTRSRAQEALGAANEALGLLSTEENTAEYARACVALSGACITYASLGEVGDDEALPRLQTSVSYSKEALQLVSPSFYAGLHRTAEKNRELAEAELSNRGLEI